MLIQYHESECLVFTSYTENKTLTSGDTKKIITNKGATGEVIITLPEGTSGVYYTFFVVEEQILTIEPQTRTIFENNAGVAGKSRSCVIENSILQIGSDENGDWFVIDKLNPWSIEP